MNVCEERESLRARESERQEKREKNLVTIEGISASRLLRLLTFHTGDPQRGTVNRFTYMLRGCLNRTFHTGDPQRGTVVIAPDATLTLPEASRVVGRGEDGEGRRGEE